MTKNGDSINRDDMKIDNQSKALKNKLLTREEIRDATITMKDSSKIDNNITRTTLRSIAGKTQMHQLQGKFWEKEKNCVKEKMVLSGDNLWLVIKSLWV